MQVNLPLGGIFKRQSFPIQVLVLVGCMLFSWGCWTRDWRFLLGAVGAILAEVLLDLLNRPSFG